MTTQKIAQKKKHPAKFMDETDDLQQMIHATISDKMMEEFDIIARCIPHVENNNLGKLQAQIDSFRRRWPEFSANADELKRKLDGQCDAWVYLTHGGKL